MATLKEVVAVTGEYEDANGQKKNRYVNMGRIVETKTGKKMLIIDSIPVNWNGMAYLNDPKPRDAAAPQGGQSRAPAQRTAPAAAPADDGFEDEIPF